MERGRRTLGHLVGRTKIAAGPLVATAQPVVIKNFQEQDDFIHSGLLQEHGIVSLVDVPVLMEGAAWGVLEVDDTGPRDFGQTRSSFSPPPRR